MRYPRIRSLSKDFSPFFFNFLNILPSWITVFIDLTTISSSDVFADKNHVTLRLSFVNVPGLNKLLRFEIFISKDRQLRAVHLILDYEPLSHIFQDAGQVIRASDPRLARIDVSKPEFLARRNLLLVELSIQRVLQEVAVLREETTATHLSLEAEIDQFHLEEEGEVPERPVEVLDSKVGLDRFSVANFPRLVVAKVDTSSKEEEEEKEMALNQRRSLRDLMAKRNKGSSLKEAFKSQVPPTLPPLPPLPPTDLELHAMKDLKKKRPMQEFEEGEVAPQKGTKQQKTNKDPKDKRSSSVDSREEQNLAEVRL